MQQPNNPASYQCYYAAPNYGMAPMQQMAYPYYQVQMNPAMNYCQFPMQYANMAPPMHVPSPTPVPQPLHECVACNARRKCKKCIKEEERKKHYVTVPSFWNPRSTYNKGIFSNRNISSS